MSLKFFCMAPDKIYLSNVINFLNGKTHLDILSSNEKMRICVYMYVYVNKRDEMLLYAFYLE